MLVLTLRVRVREPEAPDPTSCSLSLMQGEMDTLTFRESLKCYCLVKGREGCRKRKAGSGMVPCHSISLHSPMRLQKASASFPVGRVSRMAIVLLVHTIFLSRNDCHFD